MKKVIYLGLCLGSFALVLSACTKDEINRVTPLDVNDTAYSTGEIQPIDIRPASGYRVYFDNGAIPGVEGVDYGCSGSGGNCLPDVIVTASMAHHIANIIKQDDNNDQVGIKALVQSNENDFKQIMGNGMVNGIVNGNLELHIRGKIQDSRQYLLVTTPNGNNTIKVYPVKV